MEPVEQFSENPKENLHIENQIMKLKMQAENGAVFSDTDPIPPEIENIFLKNIQAFEKAYENIKQVRVIDFLGFPDVQPADKLTDAEIDSELDRLTNLMADHGIVWNFHEALEPRLLYKFFTEEFFRGEIDDLRIPGMMRHFIFEEEKGLEDLNDPG